MTPDRPQPLSEEEWRVFEAPNYEASETWLKWLVGRLWATLHAERERAERIGKTIRAGAVREYSPDEPLLTVSKSDWEKAEADLRTALGYLERAVAQCEYHLDPKGFPGSIRPTWLVEARKFLTSALDTLDAGETARAALRGALEKIAGLDPEKDTTEGFNEWGEAECFNIAQKTARAALAKDKELNGG